METPPEVIWINIRGLPELTASDGNIRVVPVHIVEGVTKIDKIDLASREERQAENVRKMVLAMVDDIRVVLIKLADRLHNMRTLKHLPEERRQQVAKETLRQLQLIDPKVKVLLTSGYNEVEAVQRFAGKGLAGFIQKPYTAAALAGKVKEVLTR